MTNSRLDFTLPLFPLIPCWGCAGHEVPAWEIREIAAHLRAHKKFRGIGGTLTAALLEVAARRLDPETEGEP